MNELTPTAELQELLKSFHEAGGVIEHVLLKSESAKIDYSLHLAAAIFTMQCVQKRLEYFELKFDTEKLFGRQITAKQFIGAHFDWEKRVLLPSSDGFYRFEETELSISKGYAMCFASPPHGLRIHACGNRGKDYEVNELFTRLTNVLFGDLDKLVEIYSWTTDWCNYFDAGHEWWGSHLWTVNRGDGTMIGIAASTTD